MTYSKLSFALIIGFFAIACGGEDRSEEPIGYADIGVVRDDEEGLLSYMSFGAVAEEVMWVRNDEESVTAVIRCSPENCNALVGSLQVTEAPVSVSIEVSEWFPAELKAQASTSPAGNLKGTEYPAGRLLTPKAESGRIIRVEDSGYFVADLKIRKKS
jgi:hypothetical protein